MCKLVYNQQCIVLECTRIYPCTQTLDSVMHVYQTIGES